MKIGIVGAGTMGSGIAQAFAATQGYEVVLCDVSREMAQKGVERIAAKLGKAVEKGRMPQADAERIVAAIRAGERKDLAACGLVIEAALEDMGTKKELFADLEKICPPDTLFATNTSSLSITEIGRGIARPVVGMHFFNPAETLKLVEVIAGLQTPRETLDKVIAIAEAIGKTPVEVQDSAGFVVNRILVPMINEAIGILADGVASPEAIDTSMKLGASHPMGPLALGDLVGLDVCLAIMEVLHAEMGEDKYRPHPLLRKMVRGGLLGRKTGQGFFTYS
ncbi:NAD(P)-binding domain-containing protein [Desulfovibrio sp. OttesenSCG-928-O18]|nr:NAD(P)-binding domain-containing protein [Desulfovibrio sp. OttesenSCG-928-O18]